MHSPTVFVATADLAGQVRGRSVPSNALERVLRRGVGWVPANLALSSFGTIAPNVFGSTGDLRLMPDPATRVDIPGTDDDPGVSLLLADQVLLDGSPWPCCPRTFARNALTELRERTGLDVQASFEHEFMAPDLVDERPFSFARHRNAEPFGSELVGLLDTMGLQPENWLPEYGAGQFEITLEPTDALLAADRAVLLKELVRDLARRHGQRVSFAPLLDPVGSGNGVHVHLSLRDAEGRFVLHDPSCPGGLSDLGQRFAGGVLAHARALLAFTAPSPTSYLRLMPRRWSVGGVFLAERNREALLRICPTSTVGAADPTSQYNLEFRAADATANPWLVLGVLIRAGLEGLGDSYAPVHIWPEDATETELAEVPTLPRSLEDALAELEADKIVNNWFHPDLLATHLAVKRAELDEVAGLSDRERCARVAHAH